MARKRGPFATFSPWIVFSIVLVLAFWVLSGVIGFLLYPSFEGGSTAASGSNRPSWLQLICGGLGLVDTRSYAAQPAPPPVVSSDVAWTNATWQQIRSGDSARGAKISLNCARCHGAQGISTADYIPDLAGLPPEVIYKELTDYRTSKRNYVFMNAVASGLSDQDVADVAAYYSSCPSEQLNGMVWRFHYGVEPRKGNNEAPESDEHISRLFTDGDPMRNVVACAACHGPEGLKTGAPPLTVQPAQYLSNQLFAFSQGTRTNDINRQMRLIATRLTPDEIERLAEYLGTRTTQTAGR
jgi:cytochrome c553